MIVMRESTSEIFNEDCMIGMAGYPDKFFHLAIADPPYFKGVGKLGYFGKKQSSIGVKRGKYSIPQWDNNIPDEKYLQELVRVSKEQIIWGINYFPWFHTVGRIVWDKVNGDSPFSSCEIASCTLHDSVRLFRYMWNGMNQAESLSHPTKMQGNKDLNEKRIHPTQKPINLYKWLLNEYAGAGYRILDTHAGSQSSRIAAYQMNTHYWGYEISPEYYESGCRRFKEHAAQQQLFK